MYQNGDRNSVVGGHYLGDNVNHLIVNQPDYLVIKQLRHTWQAIYQKFNLMIKYCKLTAIAGPGLSGTGGSSTLRFPLKQWKKFDKIACLFLSFVEKEGINDESATLSRPVSLLLTKGSSSSVITPAILEPNSFPCIYFSQGPRGSGGQYVLSLCSVHCSRK